MVEMGFLFEQVFSLINRIFDLNFYVWGIEINVGAMILFSLLVGLVLWFLRRLGD